MKPNPALTDGPPKGTAPTVNTECSTRTLLACRPATSHGVLTHAVPRTSPAAGRGGRGAPHHQNVSLGTALSRSLTQTGPKAAGWPRSNIPATPRDETLREPFHLNPLSKAKAHSAGAKRNTRKYFQKGLVTNRNKPGLFTHHFNTAANYDIKICTHDKGEKGPKMQ